MSRRSGSAEVVAKAGSHGSDSAPLVWELPYATGVAVKRKRKKNGVVFAYNLLVSSLML